jgi:GT2 family glycosyltransferase
LTYEKGWASSITEVMETYPDILSASPWCPQTQGDNSPHVRNVYEGHRVRGELSGWCIFQQRKIYDIIGELDERFRFWYCDNDYSMELQTKGIRHVLIPSSVVNHHENNLGKTGVTLTPEEQYNITSAQENIFKEKWEKLLYKN